MYETQFPDVKPTVSRDRPGLWISVILGVCAVLAVVMACGRAAADEPPSTDFHAVGSPRAFEKAPDVREYAFEARRGPSSFDRIGLHRVTRTNAPASHRRIVVLYLPGTNMNGETAVDDPRYSLPLYLAQHGVDVWSLDYRTHFIPPSTPQSALGELQNWTNELFESDIDAAMSFVLKTTRQRHAFVSGFSRGVSFAYLYAATHPERVQGMLLYDGWIGHGRKGAAPAGVFAEDVGGKHLTWEKRQALMNLVIANPEAPAPVPKYKNASDNLEHVVYDSAGFGGKGGLSNPFGGFAAPWVLARVLVRYDRYWPIVQDYEDSFSAEDARALGNSRIPVLAFSSTNIAPDWPAKVAKSAHSTGSGDVSVKTLDGWGHLDVICGTHAEAQVFAPALAWLKQHSKQVAEPSPGRAGG